MASCSGCDVDTGDRASGPHLRCVREHVHAGAATELEHPLDLKQTREAEVVVDARERIDRLGWQPGGQIVRVAEPLGEWTSVGKWRFAVHVRDLSVELLAIHSVTGAYAVLVRIPTASPTGRLKNLLGALILRLSLSLPRPWREAVRSRLLSEIV